MALAASDYCARSTTGLMGKRSGGSIHPLSWLLFLPYHVGLRVKLGVQRLGSSEPLWNRILPGWYIGGWPWTGGELPTDAPSVLDCTCELPRTHRNRYLCLPIWDTQAPSVSAIERGVAFALAERGLGKSVYVHCAHGHGRSALLLIACLVEAGEVSSCEEGLALLQSVRPEVNLNGRQRLALDAWARSRRSSVLQMQSLGTGLSHGVTATVAVGSGGGGAVHRPSGSVDRTGALAAVAAGSGSGAASGSGGASGSGVGGVLHLVADAAGGVGHGAHGVAAHAMPAPHGLDLRVSSTTGGLHSASAAAGGSGGGLPGGAAAAAVAASLSGEGGKKLS